MTYKTEQEAFWAGEFGTEYIERNVGDVLLGANLDFFAKALRHAAGVDSCIEFGANVGMNLRALQLLYPRQQHFGIEINPAAAQQLARHIPSEHIFQQSILDFAPQRLYDLVLIKTVLIHINPEFLPAVYEAMYRSASRYILLAEYYSPAPVEISYRGHSGRLFKRDFCGEMLQAYPDLKLVDYGFAYRNDPVFPQDDINWFLVEKKS